MNAIRMSRNPAKTHVMWLGSVEVLLHTLLVLVSSVTAVDTAHDS